MALVQVKNVSIEELPPSPSAPVWRQVGLPKAREPAPTKQRPEPTKSPEAGTK